MGDTMNAQNISDIDEYYPFAAQRKVSSNGDLSLLGLVVFFRALEHSDD